MVERYFFEVHQTMQIEPMDELFHPDLVLHREEGGEVRGLETIKDIIQTHLWPSLVPGTAKTQVDFLPLEEADRARYPEDPTAFNAAKADRDVLERAGISDAAQLRWV